MRNLNIEKLALRDNSNATLTQKEFDFNKGVYVDNVTQFRHKDFLGEYVRLNRIKTTKSKRIYASQA